MSCVLTVLHPTPPMVMPSLPPCRMWGAGARRIQCGRLKNTPSLPSPVGWICPVYMSIYKHIHISLCGDDQGYASKTQQKQANILVDIHISILKFSLGARVVRARFWGLTCFFELLLLFHRIAAIATIATIATIAAIACIVAIAAIAAVAAIALLQLLQLLQLLRLLRLLRLLQLLHLL